MARMVDAGDPAPQQTGAIPRCVQNGMTFGGIYRASSLQPPDDERFVSVARNVKETGHCSAALATIGALKLKLRRFLPNKSVGSPQCEEKNSARESVIIPFDEMPNISKSDLKDRYRKFRCCGCGEFGKVFRAFDRKKAKTVAIKHLAISDAVGLDKRMESLKTEISILHKCAKDCDYITRLYSTFHHENNGIESFWIVMEFCDFGSLKDLITILERENDLLPEAQIAMIMSSVIKGLICLHNNRIIHRDIKPGNILLTSQGFCKLADFGVSADLGTQATDLRSTFTGTIIYCAPEVATGSHSYSADVWSLAATVYHLTTLRPPFGFQSIPHALMELPQLEAPQLPQRISPHFRHFLASCFKKEPKHRPTTVNLNQHAFILPASRLLERKDRRPLIAIHRKYGSQFRLYRDGDTRLATPRKELTQFASGINSVEKEGNNLNPNSPSKPKSKTLSKKKKSHLGDTIDLSDMDRSPDIDDLFDDPFDMSIPVSKPDYDSDDLDDLCMDVAPENTSYHSEDEVGILAPGQTATVSDPDELEKLCGSVDANAHNMSARKAAAGNTASDYDYDFRGDDIPRATANHVLNSGMPGDSAVDVPHNVVSQPFSTVSLIMRQVKRRKGAGINEEATIMDEQTTDMDPHSPLDALDKVLGEPSKTQRPASRLRPVSRSMTDHPKYSTASTSRELAMLKLAASTRPPTPVKTHSIAPKSKVDNTKPSSKRGAKPRLTDDATNSLAVAPSFVFNKKTTRPKRNSTPVIDRRQRKANERPSRRKNALKHKSNPNASKPNALKQKSNPNASKPNILKHKNNLSASEPNALKHKSNPNASKPNSLNHKSNLNASEPAPDTRHPALNSARRHTLDSARRPAPDSARRPALNSARRHTLDSARRPALDSARRPALDSARRPAPDSARRPAPDSARRPAPDSARRPALDSARRPAPDSARRPAQAPSPLDLNKNISAVKNKKDRLAISPFNSAAKHKKSTNNRGVSFETNNKKGGLSVGPSTSAAVKSASGLPNSVIDMYENKVGKFGPGADKRDAAKSTSSNKRNKSTGKKKRTVKKKKVKFKAKKQEQVITPLMPQVIGLSGNNATKIEPKIGLIKFGSKTYTTISPSKLTATRGKTFYEVTLHEVGQDPQFGWIAPKHFENTETTGVGDDAASWGVDGVRKLKFHDSNESIYRMKWRAGDTIGMAADLDRGTLTVGHNGKYRQLWKRISTPRGRGNSSSTAKIDGGLAPGLSGSEGIVCTLNTGQQPWKYPPPNDDYKPFSKVAVQYKVAWDVEKEPAKFDKKAETEATLSPKAPPRIEIPAPLTSPGDTESTSPVGSNKWSTNVHEHIARRLELEAQKSPSNNSSKSKIWKTLTVGAVEILDLPIPEDSEEGVWQIMDLYDKFVVRVEVLPQIRSILRGSRGRFEARGLRIGHVVLHFGYLSKTTETDEYGTVRKCIMKYTVDLKVIERTESTLNLTPQHYSETDGDDDKMDGDKPEGRTDRTLRATRRRLLIAAERLRRQSTSTISNSSFNVARDKMDWLNSL